MTSNFPLPEDPVQTGAGPQSQQAGSLAAPRLDSPLPYPATKKEPVVKKYHGVEIVDPYNWLKQQTPEAAAWTKTQDDLARTVLNNLPGREQISSDIKQLMNVRRTSAPIPCKESYFYTRQEADQNQPALFVSKNAKEQVVFDPNQLSTAGAASLDWHYPSPDGRYVAYGSSTKGSEQSVLRIRDTNTGLNLPLEIPRTSWGSVAWLPDGKGFFYSRYPDSESVPQGGANYHRMICFHTSGTDLGSDKVVFVGAATDFPSVVTSPNGKWVGVIVFHGSSAAEFYVRPTAADQNQFKLAAGDLKKPSLNVPLLLNDAAIVRTNEGAPQGRVLRFDLETGTTSELIPERKDAALQEVAAVGGKLVASYVKDAASTIRVHDAQGKFEHEIKLPSLGTVGELQADPQGKELFFQFSSFTYPPTVFRYDTDSRQLSVWAKTNVPVDPSAFVVEQVKYESKDGTVVPMFLVHHKDAAKDGQNATMLTGYGGFGRSMTPSFNALQYEWVKRGGIVAVANLRGGGEYGEAWHKAGMLENKQNTFDDFTAAGEYLIREKWTSPGKLGAMGGSNGGLTVGAAITQKPKLFGAAVCSVPLLNMLEYQNSKIAKLWIPEYGTADDPRQFEFLRKYSPYHNVADKGQYPAVLFTSGENDPRVDPTHARQMAARLQATGSKKPILLRTDYQAGHGAGTARDNQIQLYTDIIGFLGWQLKSKAR